MLLTRTQIEGNLRRTAEKGLISLLNQYQLEQLALKYFGVYQDGQLIGYQCPYSGEVITNFNDIVLEHIIPVSSNGGTVLFNCIPTSKEVNGINEKGAKHLVEWWTNSKYWDTQTPVRLEKLLNYMLEAYELVFREYTIEEVENSYLEIENDENILEEENNLSLDERTESNLSKQAKNNGIHSYLGFILDCINTLEKNNINTTSIKEKLANLEEQNIFKDIERYQLYQVVIKQLIISRLGDDNSSYLSYTLNFDIKKLMDSINLVNQEDIYNELDLRLKNIEQLLSSNNLSTVEYFKSLRDIADINIIYQNINNISQEDINIFLVNIKIGIDTKIDIFIDMLSEKQYTSYENGISNNHNIFSDMNKISFKGYESVVGLDTARFWHLHSIKIKERLNELKKKTSNTKHDIEKYQRAIRAIDEYKFQSKTSGLMLRIDKFIEMLSDKQYTSYESGIPNKSNIFSQLNQIPFKDYESIEGLDTSGFWSHNSDKIEKRLDYLITNANSYAEKTKYEKAKKAIKEYVFQCKDIGLTLRIDCFIEMLSDKQYTSYENGRPNSKNVFGRNQIPFKGYENIEGLDTSGFWNKNSDKIEKRLKYLEEKATNEEEIEKYKQIRRKIEEYEFTANLEKRIDCFIEMLFDKQYTSYENGRPNFQNIFGRNQIPFKGYENIEGLDTSGFWNKNSDKIEKRLKYLEEKATNEEEIEKYKQIRRKIEEYKFTANLEKRIDCFIEMLSNKKYTSYENGRPNFQNIFGTLNMIPFKEYENIKGLHTKSFFRTNSDKINERLNKLENASNNTDKNKEIYQNARRAIEEYEFTIVLEKRIDCFIEMLCDKKYTSYENGRPNENNIFKTQNKISFKGYENIEGLNTSQFWSHNSPKIILLLFYNKQYDDNNKVYIDSEKDYSTKKYDVARNAILEYLKVSNINEYIDKLEQKEKKNAKILELINLRNGLRQTLELLRTEEERLVAENIQLRNEYQNKQSGTEIRRAV